MKAGIFDTETDMLVANSGIPVDKQPRIAEFFGQTLIGNEPDGTYHQMFNIGRALTAESKRITGLTDEDLRDKPVFKLRSGFVRGWIESHDRVVAHNLSYDKQVVDFAFEHAGAEPVKWPEMVCTVEATEFIFGYRLSLTALHEHLFGETFEGAHRAEGDVTALTKCYLKLMEEGIV